MVHIYLSTPSTNVVVCANYELLLSPIKYALVFFRSLQVPFSIITHFLSFTLYRFLLAIHTGNLTIENTYGHSLLLLYRYF